MKTAVCVISRRQPSSLEDNAVIDNKDLIADARSKGSFDCGFSLAWRLLTQLDIYDDTRALEVTLESGGRLSVK